MEKEIHLITGNTGKLLAAKKAFSKYGIKIKQIDKDYTEIQAKNSLEIAEFTAKQAAKDFNTIVVREDHSLYINALGGFPGPYTNYFDKTMPAELLLKIMKDFEDRTAYMELAASLAYPDGKFKNFVYKVPLKISTELKGTKRNWDKILMLAKSEKTFAEGIEEDNVNVWLKNFEEIAKELKKN